MELLQQFSLLEIFVFTILFIFSLKGGISTIEWFYGKGCKIFNKTYQKPKELEETVKELVRDVQNLNTKIDVLVQSDKDAIKAYITKQHHHFCYQIESIDDQSLDCIEKRYDHYKKQGGNSYIHNLMEELRKLPRDVNINTP